MGRLFIKKEPEPIKKVRIKLSCDCRNYECYCGCKDNYPRQTNSGTIDAAVCGDEFFTITEAKFFDQNREL